MSTEDLFTQKLNKTVVYGKLEASLIEDFDNIETVDEESPTKDDQQTTDVTIEIESIITLLFFQFL